MNALYLMIPIALMIAFGAFYVFIQSYRTGQYDDIEGPKYRMLFEEENPKEDK